MKIVAGEGKKKREILGLPPFGAPTLRGLPLQGPHTWFQNSIQKLAEVEIGPSRSRSNLDMIVINFFSFAFFSSFFVHCLCLFLCLCLCQLVLAGTWQSPRREFQALCLTSSSQVLVILYVVSLNVLKPWRKKAHKRSQPFQWRATEWFGSFPHPEPPTTDTLGQYQPAEKQWDTTRRGPSLTSTSSLTLN